MYWTDDAPEKPLHAPEHVADAVFSIECRQLPVDHAFALSRALCEAQPWLESIPGVAVHSVHVAGSQNGWERPAHEPGSRIQLSRRTRLVIRAPREGLARIMQDLPGTHVEVDGCPLIIGTGRERPLSKETTLFSRYVALQGELDESEFLAGVSRTLAEMGITLRKAVCGKSILLATPDGPVHTRSLMLADLDHESSFRLQEAGIGPLRLMGCGIFIPHKGIEAVKPQ
jgi:CRISPR-associated protein Cas6